MPWAANIATLIQHTKMRLRGLGAWPRSFTQVLELHPPNLLECFFPSSKLPHIYHLLNAKNLMISSYIFMKSTKNPSIPILFLKF